MQQHNLPEREQLLLFLPFFPPPVFYFQFCNAKYKKSFQILSTNASVEFPKHREMAIETLLQELIPLHLHNLIEVAWLAWRRGKDSRITDVSMWAAQRYQVDTLIDCNLFSVADPDITSSFPDYIDMCFYYLLILRLEKQFLFVVQL